MTLPEHAICSLMVAQFGVRQRLGLRGVVLVTVAGIAPDLDTAAKLFGDEHFWKLHHALGHSLLSVAVSSAVIAAVGSVCFRLRPFGFLFAWCLVAALAHCLTDSLYWWGIQPLWPFSSHELTLNLIEYLDLFALGIWLAGVIKLYRAPMIGTRVAAVTLGGFSAYVLIRALLPVPTGWFHFLTGGWMYAAPQGTPVLDWW